MRRKEPFGHTSYLSRAQALTSGFISGRERIPDYFGGSMNGALQDWLSSLESWSTIIRNFGLVAAAVFALWFARKRILVADR